MYSPFKHFRKYVRYYLTATNGRGHGLHSPFVFQLVQHVLNNRSRFTPPGAVEQLRRRLRRDRRVLEIEDLGAGSRTGAARHRRVGQVARTAVKPRKYGELFYRLVRYYQPRTVVELGTSLGVTTAYMALAQPPAGEVITIEGSRAVWEVARANFGQLNLTQIQALPGNFDQVLPEVLQGLERVDLAYVDGNHRYEPTLRYFEQLLERAHEDTILVFDDIHWSAEMEKAWRAIQGHARVRCTVDLFFVGLVFLRPEFRHKQHYTIRF